MQGDYTMGWGKNHVIVVLGVTMPSTHTRLGVMPVTTSQTGKPHDSNGVG